MEGLQNEAAQLRAKTQHLRTEADRLRIAEVQRLRTEMGNVWAPTPLAKAVEVGTSMTQIATSPGGALQPATQSWLITAPQGTPPRCFFQRVLYMRFAVGGADQIVVHAATTMLRGAFAPYAYNALDATAPPRPEPVLSTGGVLIVTLDGPRQVTHVQLAAHTVPGLGYGLRI